jgi:hypothetical protein
MVTKVKLNRMYSKHKNNGSRKIFQRIGIENGWEVVYGNRLIVKMDGRKYGFSVSPNNKAVCRQIYDDCDGFLTYSTESGKVLSFNRDAVSIDSRCNRISPMGVSAYTASASFEAGRVVLSVD